MLGFLYFCSMSQPLSKQEMHNLAMNHVGKDLESRGFEFVAINSKLKKHPQFVCIDKNSQYFFVIVRVVKLPDNPNNYDVVWMETFKNHRKIIGFLKHKTNLFLIYSNLFNGIHNL